MRRRTWRSIIACAAALSLSACDLLDVSDPTAVEESDIASAVGVEYLRRDAITRLYRAVGEATMITGVLTDELVGWNDFLDMRRPTITTGFDLYQQLQELRRAASLAIPHVRQHAAPAQIGPFAAELFAIRGFATVLLAEAFCGGLPLHEVDGFKPVFGRAHSTPQLFERAVAEFDSALAHAGDSTRIMHLAMVGRGRALLGLGMFSHAAAAVQEVPTDFAWSAEFAPTGNQNQNRLGFLWSLNQFPGVGGGQGGGIDFVSAEDPRLTVTRYRTVLETDFYRADMLANPGAPIRMASGVEARLIEAEAQLDANGDWLTPLNVLRSQHSSLPPLDDPGSPEARLDLVMRERAFWLYGTVHRVGDLRRMVSRYSRAPDSVYPAGPFFRSGIASLPLGNYETATSLRFPAEAEAAFSPDVIGCTEP